MDEKSICILGGGLSGLSAGWHLSQKGISADILEKEHSAGGLCRSKSVNGFTFDYDGHLLHCRYPYTFDLLHRRLGVDLVRHVRSAWVYSHGVYCRYPFQANLCRLPRAIIAECRSGFIEARRRYSPQKPGPDNFLAWINARLGTGIAKHFMVPYNRKFWTVPPSRLNCDWLDDFIPVPAIGDFVKGCVRDDRPATRNMGYNARFWYPRTGGIGRIPEALARGCPSVHTDCEVKNIDLKKRIIRMRHSRSVQYDYLISTIPLPDLPRLIPDMPASVRSSFRKLRWNSILNINLGIDGTPEPGRHWIYFAQKNIPFFRVGFAHNFSPSLAPAGAGSLYVELSYSARTPLDKRRAAASSIAHLYSLGILKKKDRILCRDINDIRYGYPLYDRHHREACAAIECFLRSHRVIPAGRYGSWKYHSMENAILEGKRAAEEIAALTEGTAA
ncbi:MAG TPA: FAD-dependent oxidoreductase [Candidatus Omnitrophota bacterium]|nr:FAD-dependent oxidoreductase [Candidatus Omnitrophota bacterium]